MKQTVRILLMMLLALALATSAFAQDTVSVGDVIEGEADEDTVEYEIELEEDQTVEISLESDDFDTYLYILDEDGDEVDSNDDGFDSGFNSFLEFTADDTATYTIRVDAFGGDPDGDFVLTIEGEASDEDEDEDADEDSESSGDVDLAYGDDEEFDVDGEDELEVTFEGSEGDAVTIIAYSEANEEQDLILALLDPDGDELAIFDSFGDAVLLRVELPDDGVYTIHVTERNEEELEDEVQIELLEVEVLDLGDGAQTVELDDEFRVDRMVFEAEEDARYFIFIEADDTIDGTLYVDFLEEGDSFATTRMSVSGTDQALIIFEANDDGMVTIELDFFSFSGSNEFTIEIEAE
ncbi:MAG: hypothetical protein Phog2KO_45910 [Phototrophicaceae bacterium]